MAVQLVFYVTQDSLSIWTTGDDAPERIAVFSGDDRLREFDAYISLTPEYTCALLIDVIEEEFVLETIPKLGVRDRKALIARRRERKYRRTQYRISEFRGKAGRGSDEHKVLHSAISNQELLEPWLEIIQKHRLPLAGVYSVPLMAPAVFRKLFNSSTPSLFVASHQGKKLRQVFVKDRQFLSARLSQAPGIDDDGYAQFVVTEAQRSRRYLERMRLLSNMEVLDVCVVADHDTSERVMALGENEHSFRFLFVDHDTAARKLPGSHLSKKGCFETVYVSSVLKRRPRQNYAMSGEDRYWTMRTLRHGIIGCTATVASVCSIFAAFYIGEAWLLKDQVGEIRSQVQQLTDTFEREHAKFRPILAGSHEMKLAVDTGDHILLNRLPVPWVMNQVSAVLGGYPEIQVRELEWLAESADAQGKKPKRRGNRPAPVVIPEVDSVGAILTAHITPFDGDMRKAFARIDELAADLQAETSFSHAITVEYPLNANPEASVSGEIGTGPVDFARFSIRVTYDVPDAVAGGEG